MTRSDGGRHGQATPAYSLPRWHHGKKAGNRNVDVGRTRVSGRTQTGCRGEPLGEKPTIARREVRGQDPEGNAVPMQGASERPLQVSRWAIDRAENGRRQETGGGEPAAMLIDVKVFAHITRGRVMGFGRVCGELSATEKRYMKALPATAGLADNRKKTARPR